MKEAREMEYNPGKQNQEKKDPCVLLNLPFSRYVVVMMLTVSNPIRLQEIGLPCYLKIFGWLKLSKRFKEEGFY